MRILRELVDSNSKARLLRHLLDTSQPFSVSELARLSSLPKASVSVIVRQWEKTGLVRAKLQGRNKLVEINQKFYLLPELKSILEKTKNFQKPLIEKLESMSITKNSKVKAIVVFGSRTREDFSHASDLDVLIGLESKNSPITEKIVEDFVKATVETGTRFSPVFLDKKEIKNRWNWVRNNSKKKNTRQQRICSSMRLSTIITRCAKNF